ncbi:putative plastid-lipid-associated protein 8, chloroplastic [Stylosanthes scabra]|uniref:Plastid-lipid-associated protein 8, chloroplastic n=1 Tax=Stylosanthes scabra TaxID=79078 RepID=A0ABU6S567_9FABA|nr:putative plastid-lipid-associated protein 8, chloroplastic [Stylosanthes scabra]
MATASASPLFLRSSSSCGGRTNKITLRSSCSRFPDHLNPNLRRVKKSISLTVSASVSVSNPQLRTPPDDLVSSILSKVLETDGGVLLKSEEHKEVTEVAQQLQKYCVNEPVQSPLIFGEWNVAYCSQPTSPGGGYRSAVGRLFFKTKQMTQVIEAPDIVRNKITFTALGFLDGEVSLKGKLKALDTEWIQVVFEAPELKLGSWEAQYGGESQVKLRITYIDDKIRLGVGSRGSLFVFQRK